MLFKRRYDALDNEIIYKVQNLISFKRNDLKKWTIPK